MTELSPAPVGVRALSLAQSDPLRAPVALRTLASVFAVPVQAETAGVATIVDGNALLSHTRLTRGQSADLATVVGTPRGRTAVVQFTVAGELRPRATNGAVHIGPFRARGYAAAVVGGPKDADAAAAARAMLVQDLPDALQRCVTGNAEGEAFFLAVLAHLQQRGVLERPHDNADHIVEAVRAVDERCQAVVGGAPRQVSLSSGVDVLHIARGLPSAMVVVTGLEDAVADAVDPRLADSATARERNRRYRGTFCAGALTDAVRADGVPPAGCQLTILPPSVAVHVGRDGDVRLS